MTAERPVAAKISVTASAKSTVFFKEVFFAVTIIAAELMAAVAKNLASEKMVVPEMLMSTLSLISVAMTPFEIDVAMKLAAVMDARVFSKCWFCKCC